jgi:hypothetical protein
MIAASARLVQISIDCIATLISGLGGMTEKPMRLERVPASLDDVSRSCAVRGQAIVTLARKPLRLSYEGSLRLNMCRKGLVGTLRAAAHWGDEHLLV